MDKIISLFRTIYKLMSPVTGDLNISIWLFIHISTKNMYNVYTVNSTLDVYRKRNTGLF